MCLLFFIPVSHASVVWFFFWLLWQQRFWHGSLPRKMLPAETLILVIFLVTNELPMRLKIRRTSGVDNIMKWPSNWLRRDSGRCADAANRPALPSWYLCHLSFVVINCQNMAGVRNANQTKTPWSTLPGMLLFLSLAVYVMGRIEMASCRGTTGKLRSNSWSALVFALGCSNKLELLKVLILGFRVCSWPRQQEGNGDTNSRFIFPWRQSLHLSLGGHSLFPLPPNWKKGWRSIFTSSPNGV